jgi:hypothetical protein
MPEASKRYASTWGRASSALGMSTPVLQTGRMNVASLFLQYLIKMTAEKSELEERPVFCKTCKSWYICTALDYWPVPIGNNRCKNWELADMDEIARRKE